MSGIELQREGWLNNSETSSYYKHLNMLIDFNIKMEMLKDILKFFEKNYANCSEKVLIMTAFSVVAFIVYVIFLISQELYIHWYRNET